MFTTQSPETKNTKHEHVVNIVGYGHQYDGLYFFSPLQSPTKSPDEESLPFKSLWALAYNAHLRIYIEPECLHCQWNDLRNSFKRADFQPALLLGIVLTQMAHGPFGGGGHQWTRQQTAEIMSETMSDGDFQALKEAMLNDRYGDSGEIPETPQDIPELKSVASLPIFVPQRHCHFYYVHAV
jgi:hypothetical protein